LQILSIKDRERERVGVQWAKKEKNKLYLLLLLLPRPLKKLGLGNYNPILQLHSIPVEVNSLSLLFYCIVLFLGFSVLSIFYLPDWLIHLEIVIGIIKRKGLIKELAAVYHAQCLFYCQQLLDLQKNCQEVTPSLHLTISFSYTCSIQFLSLKCLSKNLLAAICWIKSCYCCWWFKKRNNEAPQTPQEVPLIKSYCFVLVDQHYLACFVFWWITLGWKGHCQFVFTKIMFSTYSV